MDFVFYGWCDFYGYCGNCLDSCYIKNKDWPEVDGMGETMNDIEPCVLCGSKSYSSAIHFKKGFVCDSCQDKFFSYYYERYLVVRETTRLSKLIEDALTKTINGSDKKL